MPRSVALSGVGIATGCPEHIWQDPVAIAALTSLGSSSHPANYLRATGFTPAEIIWRREKFAVFYGAKPIAGMPPALRSTSDGLAGNVEHVRNE